MSERPNRSFGYLAGQMLAVLLVIAAVYTLYLLLSASDQTRLAVVTATISVVTLVYTQNRNTKREIDSRQFAQKAAAYEQIISTIGNLLKASKGWIEEEDQEELAKKLFDIQSQLLVWAGPEVLLAWNDLKGLGGDETYRIMERLLRALRAELGHTGDNQLGPLGLVKIYVRQEDHDQLSV
jgi:hypothetical protein